MKKVLSASLVFILLCLGTPSARAATDGCPDAWKIDTSSNAGYEELQQAKSRLGVDMVLGQPVIQYQNYSGELGSIASPKDKGELTIEDIYLYGKTQVQWKIEVQVRSCPSKVSFLFDRGTLSEYLGFKTVSVSVDPQAWASANERVFVDFTKAAQFGACIKSIETMLSPSNFGAEPRGNQLLLGALGKIVQQITYKDPCGVFSINPRRYYVYQDLSPECRYFTETSGRTTAIRKTGSCDIALALPTRDSLIIFPKFTLMAKDYEVKVTCLKGNQKKTITTYRGYEFKAKCPAGYKKKSQT